MGRRRTQRADDTLRQLLLKEHRKWCGPGSRFHIPAGCASTNRRWWRVAGCGRLRDDHVALLHAGLPSDDYAFGGRHWGKKWLLDVDGTLSEWTGEDAEAEASS